MDFAFICDGRPTEQHVVFVEDGDLYTSVRQLKSYAAALQTASQDSYSHRQSPCLMQFCEVLTPRASIVYPSNQMKRPPRRRSLCLIRKLEYDPAILNEKSCSSQGKKRNPSRLPPAAMASYRQNSDPTLHGLSGYRSEPAGARSYHSP